MEMIKYLIQVSACTAIFYLFYQVVLSRLTFFTINRWYLMTALVLSFVIPAITIPVENTSAATIVDGLKFPGSQSIQIDAVITKQNFGSPAVTNWFTIIVVVYLAGATIGVFYFIASLLRIYRYIRGKEIHKSGAVKLIADMGMPGYSSFFNYVFINKAPLQPDEFQQVLLHETTHVKQMHSVDKIFVRVVQIILWFNPFSYAFSRAIQANHEYEVDQIVTRNSSRSIYADLILKLALSKENQLSNQFSKFPLRKRIYMIFHKPSRKMKKLIYVLMIPLIVLSGLAFSKRDFINVTYDVSVIDGLEELGKQPLVIIDGKEHNSEILYRISRKCIRGCSISLPGAAVKWFGSKASDGYVEISTKNKEILYMSEVEKENLIKKRSVIHGSFYQRLILENEDGSLYDEIHIIPRKGGSVSATLNHDSKAAFYIRGKVYTEQQVKSDKTLSRSLSGTYGVGGAKSYLIPGVNLRKYQLLFWFGDEPQVTPQFKRESSSQNN